MGPQLLAYLTLHWLPTDTLHIAPIPDRNQITPPRRAQDRVGRGERPMRLPCNPHMTT